MLKALSERAARQGRKIGEFKCFRVTCLTQESAEAFWTLVDHCQRWSVLQLYVEGEVGPDGWEALRKAVCSPGAVRPLQWVRASLRYMIEGRREDLRAIWETLSSVRITVHFTNDNEVCEFLRKEGPGNLGTWGRLVGIMDRKKEEMEKKEKEKEENE